MDASERRHRAGSEAVEWYVRLQSETFSAVDNEEFVGWLRESPVHVAEMLRMTRIHNGFERFPQWERIPIDTDFGSEESIIDFSPRVSRAPSTKQRRTLSSRAWYPRRMGSFAGVAAAVLVVFMVAWLQLASDAYTLQTGRADSRQIALSDGSTVQLDPESELRVDIDDRLRNVHLVAGRAVFRVAKDANRPFVVYAGDSMVRAVGTAFGVEQRLREVVVTVSEGKIEVRRETAGADALLLHANQQVVVAVSGEVGPVRDVDSRRELAWADGRLVFDNASVSEIVAEFNRYNRRQLHVTTATLASRHVSGTFDASQPESFISFLTAVAQVRVEHGPEGDVLLSE